MAEIRRNRVKHKLEEGGVATIIAGQMTPDIIDFLGPMGFDGVWIEAEHGPTDFADIPDLTRACDLWGLSSVIRVNLNLPGIIYRTLDVGAQGIVVPHVNTAEEARDVVRGAKFHPIGERGSYTSRQGIGVEDFHAKANDESLVVILIEDIVAVNNLSQILEVDDIDVFFVANGDLAQSMGFPGQGATHPEVLATADGAISQITAAGKVAGTVSNDSTVESYIEKGARFLMNPWTPWVNLGSQAYLEKVDRASR